MENTYTANSLVSLIVYINNKSLRISFTAKEMGGSRYGTSDKDVIEAMEKHRLFNNTFFRTASRQTGADNKTEPEDDESNEGRDPTPEVTVTNCPDAVSYLKGKGAIGKMRSKDDIIATAAAIGIVFPNLK